MSYNKCDVKQIYQNKIYNYCK